MVSWPHVSLGLTGSPFSDGHELTHTHIVNCVPLGRSFNLAGSRSLTCKKELLPPQGPAHVSMSRITSVKSPAQSLSLYFLLSPAPSASCDPCILKILFVNRKPAGDCQSHTASAPSSRLGCQLPPNSWSLPHCPGLLRPPAHPSLLPLDVTRTQVSGVLHKLHQPQLPL